MSEVYMYICFYRYEDEINNRHKAENDFVLLKKVRQIWSQKIDNMINVWCKKKKGSSGLLFAFGRHFYQNMFLEPSSSTVYELQERPSPVNCGHSPNGQYNTV